MILHAKSEFAYLRRVRLPLLHVENLLLDGALRDESAKTFYIIITTGMYIIIIQTRAIISSQPMFIVNVTFPQPTWFHKKISKTPPHLSYYYY